MKNRINDLQREISFFLNNKSEFEQKTEYLSFLKKVEEELHDIKIGHLAKTNRILITVEGGLVQAVNSNFPCDTYVLDFDNEGWNVREEQKLTDPDGERIDAYLYDVPCEIFPEIVSHYVKQI